MATEHFRVLTPEEQALLQANDIDTEHIVVIHKADTHLIMNNTLSGDQIAIYPGPKSKREFAGVWE